MVQNRYFTFANQDNFDFVDDNSVDLILTDPPYNIAQNTNFSTLKNSRNRIWYNFDSNSKHNWDSLEKSDFIALLNNWSVNFNRVLKDGGNFAIFCAYNYVSYFADTLKNAGLTPKRLFIWKKTNPLITNRKYLPVNSCEYILTGYKKHTGTFNSTLDSSVDQKDRNIILSHLIADKVSTMVYSHLQNAMLGADKNPVEQLNKLLPTIADKIAPLLKEEVLACIPTTIVSANKVGNRIHPTEKPVGLLEYFIALYSKPGDTVLDCFAGSGSTGEAALNLNRYPILVEREKDFYNKGLLRLQKLTEVKQQALF